MKVVKNNSNFKMLYKRNKTSMETSLIYKDSESKLVEERDFIDSKMKGIKSDIVVNYFCKNYMNYIDEENPLLEQVVDFKKAFKFKLKNTSSVKKKSKNPKKQKSLKELYDSLKHAEVFNAEFEKSSKIFDELFRSSKLDSDKLIKFMGLESKLSNIYKSLNKESKYDSRTFYNESFESGKSIKEICDERSKFHEGIDINQLSLNFELKKRYRRREINGIINEYLRSIKFFYIPSGEEKIKFIKYDIVKELNNYFIKYLFRCNSKIEYDFKKITTKHFQQYDLHKFRVKLNNFLISQGMLYFYDEESIDDKYLSVVKTTEVLKMKLYTSFVFAENALVNEVIKINPNFQDDVLYRKAKKIISEIIHYMKDSELKVTTNFLNYFLYKGLKDYDEIKLLEECLVICRNLRNEVFHFKKKAYNFATRKINFTQYPEVEKIVDFLIKKQKKVYFQKFSSTNIDRILSKEGFENFIKKLNINFDENSNPHMSFKKLNTARIFEECDFIEFNKYNKDENVVTIKNAIRAIVINLYDYAFKFELDLDDKLKVKAKEVLSKSKEYNFELSFKDDFKSEINRLVINAQTENRYNEKKSILSFEREIYTSCFIEWLKGKEYLFTYKIDDLSSTNFKYCDIKSCLNDVVSKEDIHPEYFIISVFNSFKQVSELKEDFKKFRALPINSENKDNRKISTSNIKMLNLILLYKKNMFELENSKMDDELNNYIKGLIPDIKGLNDALSEKGYPDFYLQKDNNLVFKKEFELMYLHRRNDFIKLNLDNLTDFSIDDVNKLENLSKKDYEDLQHLRNNFFNPDKSNNKKRIYETKKLYELESKVIKNQQIINKLNFNNQLKYMEMYSEIYSRLISKMYIFERDCAYIAIALSNYNKPVIDNDYLHKLYIYDEKLEGLANKRFFEIMYSNDKYKYNRGIRNLICHFSLIKVKNTHMRSKNKFVNENENINFINGDNNIHQQVFNMFKYDRKKQTGLYSAIEEIFRSYNYNVEFNGKELKKTENQIVLKRGENDIAIVSEEDFSDVLNFFNSIKVID